MVKRAATLTALIVARSVAAAGNGRRGRALVGARRRLGTRHRHEPVGRLRLREAGLGYREILDHYYTGHAHRDAWRRASCACCSRPTARPCSPARHQRRRPRRSNEDSVYKVDACGAAERRPAQRERAAAEHVTRTCCRVRRRARAPARAGRTTECATASTAARSRSAPPPGSGLNAINTVGIENYLHGVVPARARRSGRPRRSRRRRSPRARMRSRRTCPARASTSTPTRAARSTAASSARRRPRTRPSQPPPGEVVTYGGHGRDDLLLLDLRRPHRERRERLLGSDPKPWLKGVEDPYDDASPYHRWGSTCSRATLGAKLGNSVKGRFRGIEVLKRGVSPRVVKARIVGLARQHDRDRPAAARAASACATPGSTCGGCRPRRRRAKARTLRGTRPLVAIYGPVDAPGMERVAASAPHRPVAGRRERRRCPGR